MIQKESLVHVIDLLSDFFWVLFSEIHGGKLKVLFIIIIPASEKRTGYWWMKVGCGHHWSLKHPE